jgi:hypothetical protein
MQGRIAKDASLIDDDGMTTEGVAKSQPDATIGVPSFTLKYVTQDHTFLLW